VKSEEKKQSPHQTLISLVLAPFFACGSPFTLNPSPFATWGNRAPLTAPQRNRNLPTMTYRVALKKCSSYDLDTIRGVVLDMLASIDFDPAQTAGKKVLLKPNMLGAYLPERHVTTHPAFVEAVASIFKQAGAHVQVGDSSNGAYEIDEAWNVTGFRVAAERAGAEIVPFEGVGSVEKDDIRLSKAVIDADMIVNLPKFKTHGLTGLTVAVKNLYGCVPGMVKTAYHRLHRKRRVFANCVVKIAQAVKPQLTIVDGIYGMEGNGPSGGKIAKLGFLIAGTDMHAVDSVSCKLAGLKPREMDTIDIAHELGFFDASAAVDIEGDTLDDCRPDSFDLPASYIKNRIDSGLAQAVMAFIFRVVEVRPIISNNRCKKCGLCIKSCPVDAIHWLSEPGERPPQINKKECISCFCCHEVCPFTAIDMKRSLAIKLIQRMSRKDKKR